MGVHSKLGASKYHQWKACPGSVRLSEGIPEEKSTYAAEGSEAHTWGERVLRGEVKLSKIPPDFLEAVAVYVDHVEHLRKQKPSVESIEKRFHMKSYHPDLFGTADYVAYFPKEKVLHVVDYKHGAGIPVEVLDSDGPNKQLMYYGLGALHEFEVPISTVILTIVQPRCYHPDGPVRSLAVDGVDMVEFGFELVDDAKRTEDENASIIPGDHCRFCVAKRICPALSAKALEVAENAFSPVEEYDAEKLAVSLAMIPAIESWCESVHKFAYRQAERGNPVPGYKLVAKIAREKWVNRENPAALAAELESTLGIPYTNLWEDELKSPAAVRKMLPKKDKDKFFLLDQFTQKVSNGLVLVPEADRRPAASAAADCAFNDETILSINEGE